MLFSVIVPVYNRPDEISGLLRSLAEQTYTDFEVIIVEDGSEVTCRQIVEEFKKRLRIRYYYRDNSGQGFSRNFGFSKADGNYLVVFDSDCIIPSHYFESVANYLKHDPVDAWGGPDRAHADFTAVQKAINFSMTSPLTTGGIRGRKNHIGTFHPRSFNMGISRKVYEKTGGYRITRMGEDLEFSMRIQTMGFKTALIQEAWVFHKRRTNLLQFYRQLHFFGRARINIRKFYPDAVKPVHMLPAAFVICILILLVLVLVDFYRFRPLIALPSAFFLLIFIHSLKSEKNVRVALLSVISSFIQLTAYGTGFIREYFRSPGQGNEAG